MSLIFKVEEGLGTFVPGNEEQANQMLDQLRVAMGEMAEDVGTFEKALKTIQDILAKDPQFLRAYAMLAEVYIDLDDAETAAEYHIKGYQAGLKMMPEGFSGPLDLENADVQCFLRCHAGYVESLVNKGDYKGALEASRRQLAFDPDDIFGRGQEMGELSILAGLHEEAEEILAEQAAESPLAYYGLAWLALSRQEYVQAAVYLRKAFLSAPYAMSFLTGRMTAPNLFWEQGPNTPSYQEEMFYAETLGGDIWAMEEMPGQFIEWLSQTAVVQKEKAAMIALSEKCLYDGLPGNKAEAEFSAIWNAIDEKSCEALVKEVKEPASGRQAPPWVLLAEYQDQVAAWDDEECDCGEEHDEDCGCGCH